MSEDSYKTIKTLLASTKPEELHRGLELVRKEISRVGSSEAKQLFEMVSAIFYIDTLDHPDLVPILNEAVSLTVGFGEWIIPFLVENLDAGDLKAQMVVSHALGRLGVDAIKQLLSGYEASTDTARRTFILYALGKIKSPKIVQAAHLALEAAESPDRELRDTATRAIGKFIESIPPSDLPQELRMSFMERLQKNLADPNAGIRAKAIRSYGKLAKYGHLNAMERKKLREICHRIIGTDENYDWDRAYIVRKEAEEALLNT
jgi:HEAT repeat protein